MSVPRNRKVAPEPPRVSRRLHSLMVLRGWVRQGERDKATFVAPAHLSVGFRHVVVNGVPVILDAKRIGGARPGNPLRRNV